MVEKICEIKERIIQHVDRETSDMRRLDVKEVGELVDMIKDLAEAEKDYEKAEYYRSVTEAMHGGVVERPTTRYPEESKYNEVIEPLRKVMRMAGPDEREHMRSQLKSLLEA